MLYPKRPGPITLGVKLTNHISAAQRVAEENFRNGMERARRVRGMMTRGAHRSAVGRIDVLERLILGGAAGRPLRGTREDRQRPARATGAGQLLTSTGLGQERRTVVPAERLPP